MKWGVLLILMAGLVFWACSENAPEHRTVEIGQVGVLSAGNNNCVPVGMSEEGFRELVHAAAAHDDVGIKQLEKDWQVACLPAGTAVLVLDTGFTGTKARLKSGGLKDAVIWCAPDMVRPGR